MTIAACSPLDGVLLIDKPAGPTSHDIVARVRRGLGGRPKVGHSGTLDPFATGLLLVLVGRATRIQPYLMALPKTYEVVARLGWTSSTGDIDGELVETGQVPPDPPALPLGDIMQRPPPYSAVKVDGERAYRRARRGEEVEIAPRPVTIHRFEQRARSAEHAEFVVECSAGTYVRTLVSDLNDAYCVELRRTAIGPFDVSAASAAAPPFAPLGLGAALAAVMDVVMLDAADARRAATGRTVAVEGVEGHVLLADGDGPIAIAAPAGGGDAGAVKVVVGFRA